MKVCSTLSSFACVLFLTTSSALAAAQASYTISDLGTLGSGGYSVSRGVNAAGQVTGATGAGTKSEAFLYSNGSMTNLGTLGGTLRHRQCNHISSGRSPDILKTPAAPIARFFSSGSNLLDIGDLGGGIRRWLRHYANPATARWIGRHYKQRESSFLFRNGHMIDLGTSGWSGNDWWNVASGINNSGVVTGPSYNAQGNFFGFVWKNGKMIKMGTLGGLWSQGYAINNKGQVTGVGYTKNGSAHAFITNCPTCPLKDLGTFAGSASTVWGFAINDSGVVVGQSTFGGTYHAFVYSSGKIKDLNKMIPAGSGVGTDRSSRHQCCGTRSRGWACTTGRSTRFF